MTVTTLEGTRLIVELGALRRGDLALAGGKGVGLAALIHAGMRVPPGFCVTTDAYRLAAGEAGLAPLIEALDAGAGGDPALLAERAVSVRSALLAVPVPDAVATAVAGAYRELGGGPVAVRSSATAEDLPTASFAGQQETELNVIGREALLGALQRCWASLWTERAVSYRNANGISHEDVHLAVVVQRMVDADAAGVLFTANPVTGARNQVVIDASEGLGEAVVGGLVTPDRYVVSKRPVRIRQRRLGRRETVIRPRAGGGTRQLQGGAAGAPAVPSRVVRSLTRLGIEIERRASVPQDVEWAWRAAPRTPFGRGELFVLQARPITTLPERLRSGRFNRMRASLNAEMLPIRPYPLDLSFLIAMGRRLLPAMFGSLGLAAVGFEEAIVEEDGVVVRMRPWGPRPTIKVLALPWILLRRGRGIDLTHWEDDPLLIEGLRRFRELDARDPSGLDWAGVMGTIDEAMDAAVTLAGLRGRYFPAALRDVALFFLLLALTGQRRQARALLSGVENATIRLNRSLAALGALVRSTPSVARAFEEATDPASLLERLEETPGAGPFLKAFGELLAGYGHRESVLMLPSQPTWRHAPEIPLGAIRALASGAPPPPPAGPHEWERARDRLLGHPVLGRAPLRRRFLTLLESVRRLKQFREDTHFLVSKALPVVRGCWLELGRRLVEAGALDVAEDVLHLKAEELARAGSPWPPPHEVIRALRRKVGSRKARRARLGERLPPLELAPSRRRSGERPISAPGGRPALVTGIPASSGTAEGPVRIITGPSGFGTLREGEVLVAPFTNPAWTPLFQRAAAVVVETGAVMSHAAIVAREYGIPAVMGAAGATRRLTDGQQVLVDGAGGTVSAAR